MTRSSSKFIKYLAGMALAAAMPGSSALASQAAAITSHKKVEFAPNLTEKLAPASAEELAYITECPTSFCQAWNETGWTQFNQGVKPPSPEEEVSSVLPSEAFKLLTRS